MVSMSRQVAFHDTERYVLFSPTCQWSKNPSLLPLGAVSVWSLKRVDLVQEKAAQTDIAAPWHHLYYIYLYHLQYTWIIKNIGSFSFLPSSSSLSLTPPSYVSSSLLILVALPCFHQRLRAVLGRARGRSCGLDHQHSGGKRVLPKPTEDQLHHWQPAGRLWSSLLNYLKSRSDLWIHTHTNTHNSSSHMELIKSNCSKIAENAPKLPSYEFEEGKT